MGAFTEHPSMPLVVHPHFHVRRTGVTGHVEAIVRALDARAVGTSLGPQVPKARWSEILRAAREGSLIWHAHRNNELLTGLMLRALFPDVRVVYTRHSATPPTVYTRLLYRRADRVVSLTGEVASTVGTPSEVVGHGVDLGRFAPPEDRAAAWGALDVGGERGIGVVGRVRPEKGQGDFVEAISPLLDGAPAWKPVLVGRTKPADAAWAQGLVARTHGRIALVGEQRDVAPWYRGLSIVVQPSHSEGYSLVLLEAMASGCCVVASRLPHFPGLIEHGRTGFLYPVGDVKALRELLRELLADPARVDAVGRAAAEEARRRFGIDREAARLRDVYEKRGQATFLPSEK